MNADQTLTHMRNLGKVRASKHYDANKDAINAKRRAKYAEKHGLAPKAVVPIVVIPEIVPEVIPEPIVKGKRKTKKIVETPEVLTLAIVQQKIQNLNIENKKTEKKYTDDIKRAMNMTGCQNLNECLKHPKKIIDLVNSSKKRNGTDYSENTKKSVFQSILFVIDNLKLSIDKKPYTEQFEIKKIISAEQNEDKMNEEVPTFEDYLQGCRMNFIVCKGESNS